MIDGINFEQVLEEMAEQAARESMGPGGANAEDVSRFEYALGAEGDQVSPDAVGTTENPGKPESIGDAILMTMETVRNNYKNRLSSIGVILDEISNSSFNIQSAMKIQFELMQLNIQQDATSKAADKTSQGIQTLFRQQ